MTSGLAAGLDLPLTTLALLVGVAFVAGWVDAVVGGGGLVQLPALLIGLPAGTPPAAILGTNKLSSVWGTATSAVTYARRVRPDWRTVLPLVVGSALGSAAAPSWPSCCPRTPSHRSCSWPSSASASTPGDAPSSAW